MAEMINPVTFMGGQGENNTIKCHSSKWIKGNITTRGYVSAIMKTGNSSIKFNRSLVHRWSVTYGNDSDMALFAGLWCTPFSDINLYWNDLIHMDTPLNPLVHSQFPYKKMGFSQTLRQKPPFFRSTQSGPRDPRDPQGPQGSHLGKDIRNGRGRRCGLLKDIGARVDQDVAETLPRLGRVGDPAVK